MIKFIIRRLLLTLPQIVILSFIVFLLAQAMPGDALSGMIDPSLSPEAIAGAREALGLNLPWYTQYWNWFTGMLQGDFGRSFVHRTDVTTVIGQRLYNTLGLSILTLVLTYAIAVPLGIIAGRYNGTWKDRIISGYTFFALAMPSFTMALLALFFFGFQLGWFPTGGSVDPFAFAAGGWTYIMSRLEHMFLPALSLALISTTAIIQYLRSEIVDLEGREFIITARAKGADEKRVYNKHIFRNSLLPIASFLGFQIVAIIGGAIFVESIFVFPGMGQLMITSITARDFSVMTILILMFGVASILGAMLSDIILTLVDPRIRIK
ncbi:MAG: ABC transporter permease [Turicibacter sp.]|nr:ABC transporter permease [Turicibacter sp.]